MTARAGGAFGFAAGYVSISSTLCKRDYRRPAEHLPPLEAIGPSPGGIFEPPYIRCTVSYCKVLEAHLAVPTLFFQGKLLHSGMFGRACSAYQIGRAGLEVLFITWSAPFSI